MESMDTMGWRSHLGEHSAGGGQCAVLSWSLDPVAEELAECTVLALMRREAGVLLAVPLGFLPDSILAEGALGSEESIFGPHKVFTVASLLEEGGILSQTGRLHRCFGGGLHSRDSELSETVCRGRRSLLWLQRREPIFFSSNRCIAASHSAMGGTVHRRKNRLLHTRGGGGCRGGWIASSRSSCAQAKICATRGYSYRRWCKGKGKEANRCHFGTGHGKHVGGAPENFSGVGVDVGLAS